MNKKSTIEIRDKAIRLYNDGISAKKISDLLGFNESTVRKWLKDKNISLRNSGYYNNKYSEELVYKIKSLYEDGEYSYAIDKKLGLRRGATQYLLSKNGFELRHRGPRSLIRKEDFFDDINTEEKAYFLGFIVADGNISINNGQYSLKLHIAYKDKEIIEKFLVCIGSSNKAKHKISGKTESYYVSLTSVYMCKKLIGYGVVPRKTGKEYIPKCISKRYMAHFLRGFFDGDGITDISKKRSGFVGSANMIQEVLEILNENLTTYYSGKNKVVKYFLGGKRFSRKLYTYLYKDATIYLERKKERLEGIIQK